MRIFTGYENAAAGLTAQWQFVVEASRNVPNGRRNSESPSGCRTITISLRATRCQYELIRAVDEPNCKALFDAWAPALHGADLEAAAPEWRPSLAHTTIANYQRLPRYRYETGIERITREVTPWMQAVPIDEGFIDYRGFLGRVVRGRFQRHRGLRNVLSVAGRRQSCRSWMTTRSAFWNR